MQRKRQFRGTSKPHPFFERMLRKQGSTRQLSVTKVLPKNWKLIRMEVIEQNSTQVTLRITKLLEYEQDAQHTITNKERKQNA